MTMTSRPFTQHLKSICILWAACWPKSVFSKMVFALFTSWTELHVGRLLVTCTICWETRPLEHVDMLVDKGSSIYNTMNMKSGIDNALLRAADPLLQSFMKLDDRGGFLKQADKEQGLLFSIRARGSEERWLKGTTFLGCRTRFVCHVVALPPFQGHGEHLQEIGRTRLATTPHSSLSATVVQRTMCLRSSCPSAAAFGTASMQWHGMRMTIASLPTPTAKMVLSRLLFGTGRMFQTCRWKFQQLGLRTIRSKNQELAV